MNTGNILGAAVGLLGIAIVLNVAGKVLGKGFGDSLKVKKSSSNETYW